MALLICQACSTQQVLIKPKGRRLPSALTHVFLAGHHFGLPHFSLFLVKASGLRQCKGTVSKFGAGVQQAWFLQPACTRPGTCVVLVVKVSQSSVIFLSETRLKALDSKLPTNISQWGNLPLGLVFARLPKTVNTLTSTAIKKMNKLRLQTLNQEGTVNVSLCCFDVFLT